MRTLSRLFAASFIAVALACAGGEDSETKDGTGKEDPGGADAPRAVSFNANPDTIGPGGTVSFTAIVTDPQGIADVIGGELLSEGGDVLEVFSAQADEGAYSADLSWEAINGAAPVEFAMGESDARVFRARFYDQAGHAGTAEVTVTLTCDEGLGACNGSCVNLLVDQDNCGECGNACSFYGRCNGAGFCMAETPCLSDMDQTCDEACAAEGMRCDTAVTTSQIVSIWRVPACDSKSSRT